jgi:protein TonB
MKKSHSLTRAAASVFLIFAGLLLVSATAAAMQPEPDTTFHIDCMPRIVRRVNAVIPPGAKPDPTVMLVHVRVDVGGRVSEARIARSRPPLDEPAMRAARQWLFRPALRNGRPVPVWIAIPVRFVASSRGSI